MSDDVLILHIRNVSNAAYDCGAYRGEDKDVYAALLETLEQCKAVLIEYVERRQKESK